MADKEFEVIEYPTPEPTVIGQSGPRVIIFDGRRVAIWMAENPDHVEPLHGETGQRFETFHGPYLTDPDPELERQALAAYKANPPEYEPLPEGAK